jgi:glycosyltransferase involved in cell wall biosynthesis
MRIALVAPPFIPVPPPAYGGTELFIANLAEKLQEQGADVVLYTVGESALEVEKRYLFEKGRWPIEEEIFGSLQDLNHSSWAIRDAAGDCDLIHLNNAPGLAMTRFISRPCVYTMHHVAHPILSGYYSYFPEVQFVTISRFQQAKEVMPKLRTIHHGLKMALYTPQERKQDYLAFLGRIAPMKGTHLAIEVAKRAGMPLKIAGEVQPLFKDYFDAEVKPHIDGKNVEYVGEADLDDKNELLANARAMLFPIQWDEPFGLVLIEAMACGTPVLALPGGSAAEIVEEGVAGYVCRTVDEMVQRARELNIPAAVVRKHAEDNFSAKRMAADYLQLYREMLGGGGQTENVEEEEAPRRLIA